MYSSPPYCLSAADETYVVRSPYGDLEEALNTVGGSFLGEWEALCWVGRE